MKKNENTLVWVKLTPDAAVSLTQAAKNCGISRADYIRLIITSHLQSKQPITITTESK